ncbi:hypothetical protein J3R30DRAFT_2352837 [Lentinula aciculospora]|nr:hypothetical protein J3R30DRAFT_2352837 [Lentinula aciculospora]
MVSMFMFIPIWVLFPMMSASLGEDKLINALTWVELALQIILYVIMDMGFSSAFIYVRASAPNAYSLGVTNGLAQTGVSIARAIGPASATSLFALSVQISRGAHTKPGLAFRWLGANLVYEIFILISVGAVIAVRRLPEKLELSKANEEVDVNGNEL